MGKGDPAEMMIQTIETFLSMGGFGEYVWSAFGFTSIILLTLFASTAYRHKKITRKQHASAS
jgi:heme exporter protein CcmD